MLSCRVGIEHVEDIEDAVQSALLSAIEKWTITGVPENPTAWLFRVAHNRLVGELRSENRRSQLLREHATAFETRVEPADDLVEDTQSDLVRMLFVSCDPSIPIESQLVFALKTLCGFDVREIAIRLFASETNVYKRLGRARDRLRKLRPRLDSLTHDQYSSRRPAVLKVIYVMFTEGYLASKTTVAVRRELCEEAIRLAHALVQHAAGQAPEAYALLALMYLHIARIDARIDGTGGLRLLEEQDRARWSTKDIGIGLKWLTMSAAGDSLTRYHAEAAIAAEHCLAPSFRETRWHRVAECYAMLENVCDSPLHRLNRAVAVAEWKGPADGLALIEDFQPPAWLSASYMWSAVCADLHRRCGNDDAAAHYRERAFKAAPTPHIQDLLRRRWTSIENVD